MAKKKRVIADKVRNRKTDGQKKTNPFEVKVNRQKHQVLGRKIAKHDRGLPGVSRSKANKRRKETLLQEYEQRFKANKLVDRRFGENDTSLSVEDKMLKRYAMEREKHTGGSKFNLNDDEELTHYGQSLSEIEKFDDPEISDEDEDSGKIGGKAIIGGFGGQSLHRAFDRQSEREKTVELTEELDEQWKDVAQLLRGMTTGKTEKQPAKNDDYDITVRELKFEIKGKATDRLKTEEELAKEEKERLENLEADRVRRMKGVLPHSVRPQSQHFSADSLDDGFVLDTDDRNRGKVRFLEEEEEDSEEDEEEGDEEKEMNEKEEGGGEEEDGGGEESGDEESDAGDNDNDDNDNDGADEADKDNSDEHSEGESEDSFGDVLSDSEEEKDNEESVTKTKSILKKKPETKTEKKKKKEVQEAAAKELPYTFEAPDNYDALLDMLHGRSDTDQLTIIERIRKCHHASLADGNKAKMETLLQLLIHYYGRLALQEVPSLSLIDKLTGHIYDLTQSTPNVAAETLQEIIQNQQADFTQMRETRRPVVLGLDTLLYLKLVSVLFPTSDFNHPVTVPALIFMSQLLGQTPVNTERDVACGLFLCNLCLEYVSESKRFIPEVISFLHGVLFLASKKEPNKIERVSGPFKPVGKSINLLHISDKKSRSCIIEAMKLSQVFGVAVERESLSSTQFKLCLLHCCVSLLQDVSRLYSDLPAHIEIFAPVLYMCDRLPTTHYPTQLKDAVSSLQQYLKGESQKARKSLVFNRVKPKPLQMFEPQIEETWDGHKKKSSGGNKAYNEKQRLLHKVKKETKGAMREIRKDSQFLARHQQQETMERDSDRKRKVKVLYGHLANQEGDYNKLKKKKKR
ncbi:nucleolar protein 14-like [Haliotis rubra]|uniref:nucleolar protein 14-like n=1 Tax=Haliotis rubra TaxID=36100 RepID=UPI001EE53A17|nr:nucleolar protein 14-like [Haliotis rubra]